MLASLAVAAVLTVCPPVRLSGQIPAPPATRLWHSDERAFITDLTVVTAVAATRSVVYVASPGALAVYDRAFLSWKETVGPLDGYPRAPMLAMVADPNDDTAWLTGPGRWVSWSPFERRLDTGPLPGLGDAVVLDARDPSRGAYFHTGAGWYLVRRGAIAAEPATDLPPPERRLESLNYQSLIARVPALDAIRFRVARDEHLRDYRMTSAAVAPLTNEIYVGTDGNGAFRVDPLTYAVEALPRSVLGAVTGAVGALREDVCVAGNARAPSPRRGITCLDASIRDVRHIESAGLAGLPVMLTRRLLLTSRALWAATDQGLFRADRRGEAVVEIGERAGLPSRDVLALWPAPTGVWVGTTRGLAFVTDTGRAVAVTRTMPSGPVLALSSAWDTLWAGTPAGLALLTTCATCRDTALLLVDGPGPVREPIVALAHRGDTLVAATATRFVVRASGDWRVMDAPGRPIGRITAMAPDTAGVWVAGTEGFAFFDPARPVWNALIAPGDVPHPVHDIVAAAGYVWVATDVGLVRYDRRILVP